MNYSTFFLKYFLNITGNNDIKANNVNTNIEVVDIASRELVNVCKVFPACMARTDGGATP